LINKMEFQYPRDLLVNKYESLYPRDLLTNKYNSVLPRDLLLKSIRPRDIELIKEIETLNKV
jgi:hypothetical protein